MSARLSARWRARRCSSLLEHVLGGLSDYWHIYLGAILLGVVLFARGGLFGLLAGREVAHD